MVAWSSVKIGEVGSFVRGRYAVSEEKIEIAAERRWHAATATGVLMAKLAPRQARIKAASGLLGFEAA